MPKKFNITGIVIPERHYMANTDEKVLAIMEMVVAGQYFIINRPRQYGKTTMVRLLLDACLEKDFLPVKLSFERLSTKVFESETLYLKRFLEMFLKAVGQIDVELEAKAAKIPLQYDSLDQLHGWITDFVRLANQKVVLLIDEVDKSSNNQLFLSFLGILRDKFLEQASGGDVTFHSVILTGVHDIKTLKLKLRADEEQKYNSPWNIATDFKVEMSLLPHEIEPMLEEYAADKTITLDAKILAEKLFYYTSGYPFLVSKLCQMYDETIFPAQKEKAFSLENLEFLAKELVKESNTNFDSLTKNLENNPDLYSLVHQISINATTFSFNSQNPLIGLGLTYGIFKNDTNQPLQIHNRIYSEVISSYMISKTETASNGNLMQVVDPYLLPNRALNMEKLLRRFQLFMRESYSPKDRNFIEKEGRLLFLAFFRPILNGKGYTFIEPQISEEKRLDVAVTFYDHKYVIELKIWRGEAAHNSGLAQLVDYLDRQGLEEGFLIIFDHRKIKKEWRQEWIDLADKRVFAVWV